jgi:hypothetical protein
MLDLLLYLFAGFALALTLIMAVRIFARKKPPNAAIDALRSVAADQESSRSRDWPELADEICAEVFSDADPNELKAIFARYHFKLSKSHGFSHETPDDVVADTIERLFPSRGAEVRSILQLYKAPVLGVPVARVHLDILKASGGKFEALKSLAKLASQDVREIMALAEAPNVTKALTQSLASGSADLREELKRAADQDLREFVAWHSALPTSAQPQSTMHRDSA